MAMTATERKQKQRASKAGYALERECGWRAQGIIGASYQLYLDLLQEQGGLCAVCHINKVDEHSPLDHDHKVTTSYNVRGVLCQQCNLTLGQLENLRNVTSIEYVRMCSAYLAAA
jgi:hypothetical protein